MLFLLPLDYSFLHWGIMNSTGSIIYPIYLESPLWVWLATQLHTDFMLLVTLAKSLMVNLAFLSSTLFKVFIGFPLHLVPWACKLFSVALVDYVCPYVYAEPSQPTFLDLLFYLSCMWHCLTFPSLLKLHVSFLL